MSFLKRLFGSNLDGEALARSSQKDEYAQIALLARFVDGAPLDDAKRQQAWSRVLPRTYADQIDLFVKQGWLERDAEIYRTTVVGQSYIDIYRERLDRAKDRVMAKVRAALAARDAGEALDIRRTYEASYPLGKADWTGPAPQLSYSALTRRILYLDHWLLDGFSSESATWLKEYAAEQHLWGVYWRLSLQEIPDSVQRDVLSINGGDSRPDIPEIVYWKARQLALYVDNQATWQRCKGGDHVRRIEIVAANDEFTCERCRQFHGKEYLVDRAPELPHRTCTSIRGCRCRYEPVLESSLNAG